jgi:hypothetical protein
MCERADVRTGFSPSHSGVGDEVRDLDSNTFHAISRALVRFRPKLRMRGGINSGDDHLHTKVRRLDDSGSCCRTTRQSAAITSDRKVPVMKPYLIITGTLLGIFSAFHVWATLTALNRLAIEPGLVAGRAAIAIASCCLTICAWRLARSLGRGAENGALCGIAVRASHSRKNETAPPSLSLTSRSTRSQIQSHDYPRGTVKQQSGIAFVGPPGALRR